MARSIDRDAPYALSLTKFSSNQEPYTGWTMTVTDQASGMSMDFRLNPEQFSDLFSGIAHVRGDVPRPEYMANWGRYEDFEIFSVKRQGFTKDDTRPTEDALADKYVQDLNEGITDPALLWRRGRGSADNQGQINYRVFRYVDDPAEISKRGRKIRDDD